MIEKARQAARKVLSRGLRQKLSRLFQWPPLGLARLGLLLRKRPVSREWGGDRGLPIDRYYIETFLAGHAADIGGRVLEIKEDLYASRFGGRRIEHIDILSKLPGNPAANIVADLIHAPDIPDASYDCIIFTQTLQFIYDFRAALGTLHRILKPGGVLLITVPAISQISRHDMELWGDFWRFTSKALERLLQDHFLDAEIHVKRYGNLKSANAFLTGLAAGELLRRELDAFDPDYELLICSYVVKSLS